MTGSVEAGARTVGSARGPLGRLPLRYLAVDGGGGSHLFAALAGADPWMKRVASPRHANLLVVVEPVTQKLAPALVEVARAIPRPGRGVVIGDQPAAAADDGVLVRLEEVLPGIQRLPAGGLEAVVAAARSSFAAGGLRVPPEPAFAPETIALPGRDARELATEPAVLSLGPIQPLTAGPLRLLLVCDGEQVVSAQVDAGYAHRRLADRMARTSHTEAARLAASLDPLAPLAGRLAYIRAVERLQRWEAPAAVGAAREAVLSLERAHSHLWWLVRFLHIIELVPLAERAATLAHGLADVLQHWSGASYAWLVPGAAPPPLQDAGAARVTHIAAAIVRLRRQLDGDRLLGLRTNGIGVLPPASLTSAGASGPARLASDGRPGDVRARLLTRLDCAAADLEGAADVAGSEAVGAGDAMRWDVPAGEANAGVDGPRGRIGLRLVSGGGTGPSQVEWQRPSAVLLGLLAEALAGQKLADAEVIVASLDLSMAEADG